jgi:hypothetical protein
VRPSFGPQKHLAPDSPAPGQALETLQRLKSKWIEVVGSEMGLHSKPKRFSGRKKRRLVVALDSEYLPPWGFFGTGPNRRVFTLFRKSINDFIQPMKVDHIDFITK